jgi:hypothetical protein
LIIRGHIYILDKMSKITHKFILLAR